MLNYLLIDKYNKHKGHHISFDDNGQAYYNQAIYNELPENPKYGNSRKNKKSVPGYENWIDFYEDEPVKVGAGGHGYQEYINQAYKKYLVDRPLEVGDVFDHYFNQADREVEILAVIGDEALGFYAMPAGRVFFGAYDRNKKKIKRTLAVKTMPKKWLALVDQEELQQIQDEYL